MRREESGGRQEKTGEGEHNDNKRETEMNRWMKECIHGGQDMWDRGN